LLFKSFDALLAPRTINDFRNMFNCFCDDIELLEDGIITLKNITDFESIGVIARIFFISTATSAASARGRTRLVCAFTIKAISISRYKITNTFS
jgi:cobyric acid synthase